MSVRRTTRRTYAAGATVAEGKFGTGLALDGVDDRVEVPFDRSIDVGAQDFTMMAWIKYGAATGSHAILWAYRTGSGTTPQVWLRAEPEAADNRNPRLDARGRSRMRGAVSRPTGCARPGLRGR
ncbi:hypothetical protein EV652_101500 [Kribbella steppae]|uniref:Uncharacterized protein n=1 Tax=Kribbella steppae TaxID=2512223 RepID=A0A4R2HWS3_9ACTN|nr:hypothetical protein [Kribbella steppae]TCO35616.1 hypothetical protein EV652_101500 [Kribbella steppae]